MELTELVHKPNKRVYQKKSGLLTVVGTAAQVWEDLDRFGQAHTGDILVVNEIAPYFKYCYDLPVNHVATMHPDYMPHWMAITIIKDENVLTHANKEGGNCDIVWNLTGVTNSGNFGALVGVMMGYDPVVMCGIPCDGSPYFYSPPDFVQHMMARETGVSREGWRFLFPYLKGRVFSMSGWTRDNLGEPPGYGSKPKAKKTARRTRKAE